MKKIFYSSITKTAAYCLILIFAFTGAYKLAGIVYEYNRADDIPVNEDTLRHDMCEAFDLVFEQLGMSIRSSEHVTQPFSRNKSIKDFEYYGSNSSGEVSNMNDEGKTNAAFILLPENAENLYAYMDEGGVVLSQENENLVIYHNYDYGYYFGNIPTDDFLVCVKPTEKYMAEYKAAIAERQSNRETAAENLKNETAAGISLIIGIIILTVYLFAVCGKKSKDGGIELLLIDRAYIELSLLAAVIFSVLGASAMIVCIDTMFYSPYTTAFQSLFAAAGTAAGGIVLALLMSLARNLKNRTLAQKSIIAKTVSLSIKSISKIFKSNTKYYMLITGGVIALYGLAMIFFKGNVFIGIILTAAVLILALKSIAGFEDLGKGINELSRGNIGYKINSAEKGPIGDLCRSVDDVGGGMAAAVEKQLAAERMKSQLITNVSHDLKTPLTSIINYAKLLNDMKLNPDEANDYAKIIEVKAMKLKTLTSDLFDISKVQSGNEAMNKETLDAALLINQSIGELDEQIKKSGLDFNVRLDENCFISGDGDKLSRVFENLFVNAVKYSLKGTRVYVSAHDKNGKIRIEIKNISAYPMNFDNDEITKRFVRGDLSRSTEGNGLGLAIAKSYVEAMGGKFSIVTDGDLFKAVIELKKPTDKTTRGS